MLDFLKRNWMVIVGTVAVFVGLVKYARSTGKTWFSWL